MQPKENIILVCIDDHPKSMALIKAGSNKAKNTGLRWAVIYVETPDHYNLVKTAQERVLRYLTQAEELGARIKTIEALKVIDGIQTYIENPINNNINISHLIIGQRDKENFWSTVQTSLAERLARRLRKRHVEVQIIPLAATHYNIHWYERLRVTSFNFLHLFYSLLLVLAAYLSSELVRTFLTQPSWQSGQFNITAFFIIACVISSLRFGLIPGVVTAFTSFFALNYYYVEPFYTLRVDNSASALSITIFLLSAIMISFMGAYNQASKTALIRKERRSQALYSLHRIANQANDLETVLPLIHSELRNLLDMDVTFFLPSLMNRKNLISIYPKDISLEKNDTEALEFSWREVRTSGLGTLNIQRASWRFEPLITPNGEIGILGIKPDDHLKLDASFGRLLTALADQIANIFERLELTRLMSESRVSEEREKLRAMLLSSVSHDLKTPLASIIGSLSVYQRMLKVGRLSDENAIELTETALEEAQRLNSFISNILDMTRLESGKISFNLQWYNPVESVKRVGKRLRQRLKSHDLVIIEPETTVEVQYDVMMTEQLLQNIIDNAAKYSPALTEITVTCEAKNEFFTYTVRDRGEGIPKDKFEAVFDKYERLKQSDSQVAGTGLGLAICKAVIEKQGGKITVENHAEGGAMFTLYFPNYRAFNPDLEVDKVA